MAYYYLAETEHELKKIPLDLRGVLLPSPFQKLWGIIYYSKMA